MANMQYYDKAYKYLTEILFKTPMRRNEAIEECIKRFGLSEDERNDKNADSKYSAIRTSAGVALQRMKDTGFLTVDAEGFLSCTVDKPLVLRYEKCVEEILKLITVKPMSKNAIRQRLITAFGTDLTVSKRDDEKLFTYIGQILKSLINNKVLTFDGGVYRLCETKRAAIGDITATTALCADFLILLHSKGGEFFEKYFITLISKQLENDGKKIDVANLTAGADDGGIDGIIYTTDELGFKETVMMQMKNRNDITSETDIRSFYGALCALGGTRGIYAITSDFHPQAKAFINSIDNLIGLNGKDIFSIACNCKYGIVEKNGILEIDRAIL